MISAFSFKLTSFGKRFRRLATIEKVLAVVAAVPGAMLVIAVSFGLIAILMAIIVAAASASKEERISEIEEGVRRAIKR